MSGVYFCISYPTSLPKHTKNAEPRPTPCQLPRAHTYVRTWAYSDNRILSRLGVFWDCHKNTASPGGGAAGLHVATGLLINKICFQGKRRSSSGGIWTKSIPKVCLPKEANGSDCRLQVTGKQPCLPQPIDSPFAATAEPYTHRTQVFSSAVPTPNTSRKCPRRASRAQASADTAVGRRETHTHTAVTSPGRTLG